LYVESCPFKSLKENYKKIAQYTTVAAMVLGALISALIFEMTSAFTVILLLTFMFSAALLCKFKTIS
jgi:uncharacterized membrane protein YgaE (UPF0421/DUF939 family)